jgi:membrane protein implicated in regulation of membrane protease activity
MFQTLAGSMTVLWIAAIVVLVIIEAATVGLTTIWFAVGALAALIAALCGAAIWLQVVWFLAVSIATLIFTRPLVKKYVDTLVQPTNADMAIGMEGYVTEDVDNVRAQGAVSVGGKLWTARSESGEPIPAGTLIRGVRIEGVKLFVEPAKAEETPAPASEAENETKE